MRFEDVGGPMVSRPRVSCLSPASSPRSLDTARGSCHGGVDRDWSESPADRRRACPSPTCSRRTCQQMRSGSPSAHCTRCAPHRHRGTCPSIRVELTRQAEVRRRVVRVSWGVRTVRSWLESIGHEFLPLTWGTRQRLRGQGRTEPMRCNLAERPEVPVGGRSSGARGTARSANGAHGVG